MNIIKECVQRNVRTYKRMPRIVVYIIWMIELECLFMATKSNVDVSRLNGCSNILDIILNVAIGFIVITDGLALYEILKND